MFSLFYLYCWMKKSQKICQPENTFWRKKSNFASPIFFFKQLWKLLSSHTTSQFPWILNLWNFTTRKKAMLSNRLIFGISIYKLFSEVFHMVWFFVDSWTVLWHVTNCFLAFYQGKFKLLFFAFFKHFWESKFEFGKISKQTYILKLNSSNSLLAEGCLA